MLPWETSQYREQLGFADPLPTLPWDKLGVVAAMNCVAYAAW